jgi:hypothetical protein
MTVWLLRFLLNLYQIQYFSFCHPDAVVGAEERALRLQCPERFCSEGQLLPLLKVMGSHEA